MNRRQRRAIGAILISMGLAGCLTTTGASDGDPTGRRWSDGRVPRYDAAAPRQTADARTLQPLKIGVLAPLTGAYAAFGADIVDAAALALFEAPSGRPVELLPLDTRGEAAGAAAAAIEGLARGADALIGPALAPADGAVRAATGAGAPLLLLTADRSQAAPGVFVAGAAPEAAATRIVDYAYGRGARVLALLAPATFDGAAALRGARAAAAARGMTVIEAPSPTSPPSPDDARFAIRKLEPALRQGAALFLPFPADALAPFDAALQEIAPDLRPMLLGLETWDSAALVALPSFSGAFYAGPEPEAPAAFRARFAATFGRPPARDAALAYDLTAMLAVAGEKAAGRKFGVYDLTGASGYIGVEGPFRLTIDGVVQRRYAVVGVSGQERATVEPAAARFDAGG